MPNSEKTYEESLEWLKLKKDKGQTPDFVKKSETENAGNKFVRKFKENPFVPIGALVTMGFLSVGLKNMYEGDKMKSQMMMRGRIAAQGFTVVAILGGLFYQGMKAMKETENDDKEFAASPK